MKQRALEVLQEQGIAAAVRLLDIPYSTVREWAVQAGVDGPPPDAVSRSQNLQLAVRTTLAQINATRVELAGLMIETAVDLVKRMHQPHIELKVVSIGNGVQEVRKVELPRPPASATKDYAIAAAILVDKLRLEMGEVSSRIELRGTSDTYDHIATNPEAAEALEALYRQIGDGLRSEDGLDTEPTRALGSEG